MDRKVVLFQGIICVLLLLQSRCDDINIYDFAYRESKKTNKIFIFAASAHNGDFDTNDDGNARPELDYHCYASSMGSGLLYVRAFVSVSGTDHIVDMPVTYGVPASWPLYDISGNSLIASNWGDLFDGGIEQDMDTAIGVVEDYWTGSLSDGRYSSNSCNSWTDGTSSYDGQIGYYIYSDSQWLSSDAYSCDESKPVLCIGWN